MTIQLLLIFLWGLLSVTTLQAQTHRASRFFMKAIQSESKKESVQAKKYLEKALLEDPDFFEAYSLLGSWYFQDRQYEEAIRIFTAAKNLFPDKQASFDYPLARSLIYAGRIADAMPLLQDYTEPWRALRRQALFYNQALLLSKGDTVVPLTRINTPVPEFFPWITADGNRLIFTRRVKQADEDFLYTERDSCGGWFTARNLGDILNSPHQETALSVSADGHYLFFTKCDNRSENGWGKGGCDLYMSYRADSSFEWSVPQSFGATINTPAYEGMACLSPDNRELYFTSNRPGGYGGLDIWVARFENGLWQTPRNLGPTINTPGDESAPFLHPDNRTLYFSSNGHPGIGGNDLFMSRKQRDTLWLPPINMGYPINTTADENSMSITHDGKLLFFASDRDSTPGNFNIYETYLPEPLRPEPIMVVRGYSQDSLSRERLNFASIYISDEKTGEQLYHFTSNRGDGSFMITLAPGRKYAWSASRIGYQGYQGFLDLQEDTAGSERIYLISLLPQDYVAPVNDSLLITLQFPLNSTQLTQTDKDRLINAIMPWLYEKGIMWYVNGYTDNTGTPMLNEQLSYTRAGLVMEELTSYGIDPLHIQTRGWGEAAPVADNETESGRDANRRVEIVIQR